MECIPSSAKNGLVSSAPPKFAHPLAEQAMASNPQNLIGTILNFKVCVCIHSKEKESKAGKQYTH